MLFLLRSASATPAGTTSVKKLVVQKLVDEGAELNVNTLAILKALGREHSLR